MGAIASGGVELLNAQTVRELGITSDEVARVVAHETQELERREDAYREGRPALDVRGRVVIVIDDGLATGASMYAAVTALRRREPAEVVVAVPVAPASTCEELRRLADACICLHTPAPFYGVGQWYIDFGQTTDDEVRALLAAARSRKPAPSPAPAR